MPRKSPQKQKEQTLAPEDFEHHLLKVTFRGAQKPLLIHSTYKTWKNLQRRVFDCDQDYFAWIESPDGRSIGINTAHVLVFHFLWEPAALSGSSQFHRPAGSLRVHFASLSEPFEAAWLEYPHDDDDDMEAIEDLMFWLESAAVGGKFLFGMDQDGEHFALRIEDIQWLDFPTEWLSPPSDDETEEPPAPDAPPALGGRIIKLRGRRPATKP